ncbi:MAG TPA: class I SAM-dependent methyltransferase, partial [Actinomycetota bacterium]|nr:class I SAM-dependent methyltransferase [Actinomycetota bacterium]
KSAAADFLAQRARGGPALELGIGTGRVALLLKERGVAVHGIDASEKMVERLREKPGGGDIPVTVGDLADVGVDGSYPLIYVPFNTLFALESQEDQIRCFKNVRDRLTDDGVFVTETFVPDVTRYERNQGTSVEDIRSDRVFVSFSQHDPVTQTSMTQHVFFSSKGIELFPVFLRYAYPAEMDLMARVAGLALRERYGDWRMAPFNSSSTAHISVYGPE